MISSQRKKQKNFTSTNISAVSIYIHLLEAEKMTRRLAITTPRLEARPRRFTVRPCCPSCLFHLNGAVYVGLLRPPSNGDLPSAIATGMGHPSQLRRPSALDLE